MSHLEPDPFEPFNLAATQVRHWRNIAFFLAGVTAVTVLSCLLLLFRGPDVIIKDRLSGEPAVVHPHTGAPPITAADARNFMFHMIRLRHGWTSTNVVEQLDEYLSQCHPAQVDFERTYAQATIVPDPKKASKTVRRIDHWAHSSVRNTVVFPDVWRGIQCKENTEGSWDCLAPVTIVTQRLVPPLSPQSEQRQASIVANLLPVPHTKKTPYGLVIGAMRDVLAPSDEGA
ncbi:MAG: hypothetical protein EOO40_02020 [Deltaproteobacteria bacterium]|nr:MAG: hypothetical protein EOO40_02020 [Deltaproteobacteria bacterium]